MPTSKASDDRSYLTLGWQVTATQEPRYWLNKDAEAGRQPDYELVNTLAETIGTHTAIIAQSGSGKSFFLGRIIEELMLHTKARCLILDPNADFRKVHKIEEAKLWKEASYDALGRRGRLPHETSREEFEKLWTEVSIKIKTGASGQGKNYEQLQLRWPSLSVAFLAEDLDPILRSDLYHCHAFVQALEPLVNLKARATEQTIDLIDVAEQLFRQGRIQAEEHFRLTLEHEFDVRELYKDLETSPQKQVAGELVQAYGLGFISHEWPLRIRKLFETRRRLRVKRSIERALKAPKYVSEEVERFYFGKAREYQTAGILQTKAEAQTASQSSSARLEVIDLPSLPDRSTRLLAINSLLTNEWERVRAAWSQALEQPAEKDERVPTFIVVDEAHNLVPADPRSKAEVALREQFRTLVAEGRKYGLFLILVSQRPDKLDPLVLSECENKAVMRLGSGAVLNITKQMLGLDDIAPRLLEKCLEFEIGRALLIGRWAPDGPQIIYSAARRTIEGGRNLRSKFWAVSPTEEQSITKKEDIKKSTKSTSSASKKSVPSKKRGAPKK